MELPSQFARFCCVTLSVFSPCADRWSVAELKYRTATTPCSAGAITYACSRNLSKRSSRRSSRHLYIRYSKSWRLGRIAMHPLSGKGSPTPSCHLVRNMQACSANLETPEIKPRILTSASLRERLIPCPIAFQELCSNRIRWPCFRASNNRLNFECYLVLEASSATIKSPLSGIPALKF